ncbi:hypothetical protein [uncultured Brachyspira sp.]|uniref:hypothetical protein n=1 Tax=uncultured Brachyspira sp. TaxID=221953 RepID=UPI0025DFB84C|nr:hypothetical protein [uncultured Brachyspira sp.]
MMPKIKKLLYYDNFSGVVNKQFEDIFTIYFKDINLNISKKPDILYALRDDIVRVNWNDNRNNNEMKYLNI